MQFLQSGTDQSIGRVGWIDAAVGKGELVCLPDSSCCDTGKGGCIRKTATCEKHSQVPFFSWMGYPQVKIYEAYRQDKVNGLQKEQVLSIPNRYKKKKRE